MMVSIVQHIENGTRDQIEHYNGAFAEDLVLNDN